MCLFCSVLKFTIYFSVIITCFLFKVYGFLDYCFELDYYHVFIMFSFIYCSWGNYFVMIISFYRFKVYLWLILLFMFTFQAYWIVRLFIMFVISLFSFTIYSSVYYFMLVFQFYGSYELDYLHVFIMFRLIVHWLFASKSKFTIYFTIIISVIFQIYGSLEYYHLLCFYNVQLSFSSSC
jgi:hypothetical protein